MDLSKLIDLERAAKMCQLDVEVLGGWVASGHAPHYVVGEHGPFFWKSEIQAWVLENLVRVRPGMPVPRRVDVLGELLGKTDVLSRFAPPPSIAGIESLRVLSLNGMISGIYFLCDGPEVVYVGQSMTVIQRIVSHIANRKKVFDADRVFFLPCPVHALNDTERHYIRALRPKYNDKRGMPPDGSLDGLMPSGPPCAVSPDD